MATMTEDPTSPGEVLRWIEADAAHRDSYRHVYLASQEHRESHGPACTVYPSSSGPLLGVLTRAVHTRAVLEVGTGLGYSTLWLARGVGRRGVVHSIESDPLHASLARDNFRAAGYAPQIQLHVGKASAVLPSFNERINLIFCDADPPEYLTCLKHFERLLRPGGVLVTANLFLSQYDHDIPGLGQLSRYRERIRAGDGWQTAFLPNGLALSVRGRRGSAE